MNIIINCVKNVVLILRMNHQCVPCNMSFANEKCLKQHLTCKRHIRISNDVSVLKNRRFECNVCGKKYSLRQSLHAHKKTNSCTAPVTTKKVVPEEMQKNLERYEKECIKQKAMIETLQNKFDVQKNQIEAMQKKIDKIMLNSQYSQPPQKRKKINKDVKQQILNKQENACGECKITLSPYFELDHIIGLQFGGTDEESNLMALCRECHGKKSIVENQCRDQIKDFIKTIVREKLGPTSLV